MKTFTSSAAGSGFEKLLDMARKEPVLVTENDRPVGVFFSMEDIEDTVWGERAMRAHRKGYIGPDESKKLLDGLTHGAD